MERAVIKSSHINRRNRFGRGVTLIELMVTISVLAILLAIGVPAMGRFINDTRVSNVTNEFVNALNLARVEAVKRARLVTVCRSTSPTADPPTCNPGSDWSTGWVVFVEGSATATNDVTSANVLSTHGALSNNVNAQASNVNPITFNGTGEPIGNFAGNGMNFNYNGGCARQVNITRSGRVTVTPDGTQCGN